MRTEKELWQVVLDHPQYFQTGLCCWISSVCLERKIDFKEEQLLYDSLMKYHINSTMKIYFLGPRSQIQPRIDWIKKRMEEL